MGGEQDSGAVPPRVLLAGGGVAALEAALALREQAPDALALQFCAPRREFMYRPFAVGEPFGAAKVHRYELERLAERCGAAFHLGGLVEVDAERRTALTRDGAELPYDYLVVSSGARMLWAVPGAVTFWGVPDEGGVGAVVRRLRAGSLRRAVLTMPGGASWALPMYELALLAGGVLKRSGIEDARLTIVTPEDAPLQLFGRSVGEEMSDLLDRRGIEVIVGTHPVEYDGSRLHVAPGEPIETDAVVSLPRLEGRRIAGIPHDDDGFMVVDEHCRVAGVDRVFAAGDVTNFPVKQGGIAAQQADAVAAAILAQAGLQEEPPPFEPVLRAVLWTGEEPRYLYGHLTGGHGETSSISETPPWEGGEGKIIAGRLAAFLADVQDVAERKIGLPHPS